MILRSIFRAAMRPLLREEFELFMDERRRRFSQTLPPISETELAGIAATLKASGVAVRRPHALPVPANDHQSPPPHVA